MSEQNQMAISPVTAGLAGAAIGGIGNHFIGIGAKPEKGYGSTKELLTLKDDEFKKLAEAVKKDGDEAAKTEFKKLEDGRKIVSDAGDTLEKSQRTARKEMNAAIEKDLEANLTGDAKTTFTDAIKTEKAELETAQKAISDKADGLRGADPASEVAKKAGEYKTKYQAEVAKITNKQDSGLGKELKELEDSKAGKTGDELKAIEDNIKAKKAEIGREALKADDVKTAKEALDAEKAKIVKPEDLKTNVETLKTKNGAYNKKLVESADAALKDVEAKESGTVLEKLKKTIADKKAILEKSVDAEKTAKAGELVGDNGSLKDLDLGKFKKFLKKGKALPILIGAGVLGAAGVALSYIVGPKNEVPTDVA